MSSELAFSAVLMPGYSRVQKKANDRGLSSLAMAFALPHEYPPQRFPVVPAVHTATVKLMSDGTRPIPDGQSRKYMLCRDPAYPLWCERSIEGIGVWQNSVGNISGSWSVPSSVNTPLVLPNFSSIGAALNVAKIDGVAATTAQACDLAVVGAAPSTTAFYFPNNARFQVYVGNGAAGTAGATIVLEFGYFKNQDEFTFSIACAPIASGYYFDAVCGASVSVAATTGQILEGVDTVPYGFVWLKSWRTGPTTAPAAIGLNTNLSIGWVTAGSFTTPTAGASVVCLLPCFTPPEFGTSVVPYSRTRCNASAALLTNVTAALSKEGTILAARLKPASVDPWAWDEKNLNSVHPKLRYYGPLEKGLYTFTSPGQRDSDMSDSWIALPRDASNVSTSVSPLFDYRNVGIYNAIIASDLGSAATGTQLAVSLYTHLEFEATSSLFSPGVSSMTLESLHAAEVALLSFGHFHENPLHWAALKGALATAMRTVGPLVAPVVQHYGSQLLDRGVRYLTGNSGGDRRMPQALSPKPAPRPRARRRPPAVKAPVVVKRR